MSQNLGSEVENFGPSVLGYVDFFNLSLGEVVIEEFHVYNLLHGLFVVENVPSRCHRHEDCQPPFWLGAVVWIEKELLHLISVVNLLFLLFLFLLFWLRNLVIIIFLLLFIFVLLFFFRLFFVILFLEKLFKSLWLFFFTVVDVRHLTKSPELSVSHHERLSILQKPQVVLLLR